MKVETEEHHVEQEKGEETPAFSTSKKVRFDAEVKPGLSSSTSSNSKPITPQRQVDSRRIKFGSGKGHPCRDLLTLLSIVGILLVVTMDFSSDTPEFDPEERTPKEKAASRLNKVKESLERSLQDHIEATRRMASCDIFISSSSIPGTGNGLFAGRAYQEGETVLLDTKAFGHPILGLPSNAALSQYAFLVKHHPTLVNLEGSLFHVDFDHFKAGGQTFQFKATQQIKAGEELFVSFENHPQSSSLFPSKEKLPFMLYIPTYNDYNTIDSILDDVKSTARRMSISHSRHRRNMLIDSSHILKLARGIVGRLHESLAALIPSTGDAWGKRPDNTPSVWTAMENRTLVSLQLSGFCLTDMNQEKDGTLIVTRNVSKGEIVTVAPLHVATHAALKAATEKSAAEEAWCQTSASDRCFGKAGSSLVLCPITNAAFISISVDVENVEFQWSMNQVPSQSADQAISSPAGTLSWNILALRDLHAGEKLVVKGSKPSGFDFRVLEKTDLFPWYTAETANA